LVSALAVRLLAAGLAVLQRANSQLKLVNSMPQDLELRLVS
jgi:hypothetical protein